MIKTIETFGYCVWLTVKSSFVYGKRTLLEILQTMMSFIVMVSVWQALINNGLKAGISLEQLITYTFVSILISNSLPMGIITSIYENDIMTGAIVCKMVRPISPEIRAIAQFVGKGIVNLLLQGIPFYIFTVIFADITWQLPMKNVVAFFISLFFGGIIFIQIDLIAAYFCYFMHKGSVIRHLIEAIFMAFSGKVVPLFLLPDWFEKISFFLPVRMVFEEPISVLLGVTNASGKNSYILRFIAWISILFVIVFIMKNKVYKKVFIQGG